MNKILKYSFVILPLSLMMIFSNTTIKANDGMSEMDAQKIADGMFENLNEEDKVIQLPDGGYIHGEAYITPLDDINEINAIFNSETDDDAQTVESAKEQIVDDLINGYSPKQKRGASVPTERIVLRPGVEYMSSPFSASGWRFSGYMFAPRPDTGYYLLWTSCGDDARVGDIVQARNTLNGSIQGDIIYNNVPQYINKATLSHVYYTYNPTSGSYYKVANK